MCMNLARILQDFQEKCPLSHNLVFVFLALCKRNVHFLAASARFLQDSCTYLQDSSHCMGSFSATAKNSILVCNNILQDSCKNLIFLQHNLSVQELLQDDEARILSSKKLTRNFGIILHSTRSCKILHILQDSCTYVQDGSAWEGPKRFTTELTSLIST